MPNGSNISSKAAYYSSYLRLYSSESACFHRLRRFQTRNSPQVVFQLTHSNSVLTLNESINSSDQDYCVRATGSGDYSIPGESRFLRPFLNLASPSPAKQRMSIAQIGSSGTGAASELPPVEADAEAGVELSALASGGKAPRSRMASRAADACWVTAPASAACGARASTAPSANDKPRVQTITFTDSP